MTPEEEQLLEASLSISPSVAIRASSCAACRPDFGSKRTRANPTLFRMSFDGKAFGIERRYEQIEPCQEQSRPGSR
jgi:hypothetical protein